MTSTTFLSSTNPRPGIVIALPSGLIAAGVPVWGVRIANALAERGRCVALVIHESCGGYAPVPLALHSRVHRFDVRNAPPIESCQGDLSPYLQTYRQAIDLIWQATNAPVILSPNLAGDCYGLAAALSLALADRIRVLAVQHSDIEYETRYLTHYEPLLTRIAGVSQLLTDRLRARLPERANDIVHLPYGIPVPPRCPTRPPIDARPLRVIYAGRMDREQKRALAIPLLSKELDRRSLAHTLTMVGDGPAAPEVDRLLRDAPHALPRRAAVAHDVHALLAQSDIMILPSRYEGLSIAMLEAMAVGCVPVVARVESGANEAIIAGNNGEIADVSPDADDQSVVGPLADAIQRALSRGLLSMSAAAWHTASDRFSIDAYTSRFERLLDETSGSPARTWPADRPCAFTGLATAPSGIVPADAAHRMHLVLQSLAGRRIAIHGSGRHTLALAAILAQSPAQIVAITDDDTARHGHTLWGWPIVAPADLPRLRVSDVVISSAMHEGAILRRNSTYERQGIRVHTLYQAAPGARAAA